MDRWMGDEGATVKQPVQQQPHYYNVFSFVSNWTWGFPLCSVSLVLFRIILLAGVLFLQLWLLAKIARETQRGS